MNIIFVSVGCHWKHIKAYPVEIPILLNVAKSLEKTLALELQETLLTEKERRQILKDTLAR